MAYLCCDVTKTLLEVKNESKMADSYDLDDNISVSKTDIKFCNGPLYII